MVTKDCQKNLEEYFSGSNKTEEYIKCYSLNILQAKGLEHEQKLAIFAEVEKRMKENTLLIEDLRTAGDYQAAELESLKPLKKKYKGRRINIYLSRYEDVMKLDLKNIYELTTQVTCIPFIRPALAVVVVRDRSNQPSIHSLNIPSYTKLFRHKTDL